MPDVRPDPKPVTEGGIGRKKPDRANRRRGRVTASRDEWIRLRELKLERCRICARRPFPDAFGTPVELHHLVPRSMQGDDVADNLVPLCRFHHRTITDRIHPQTEWLAASLTGAEYAYIIGKLGKGGPARLFGV